MTDSVLRPQDLVGEKSGAEQFHALVTGIVKEQAFDLGGEFQEFLGEIAGPGGKAREGCRQEQLRFARISKRLDLAQLLRQACAAGQLTKREQSLQQQRRND